MHVRQSGRPAVVGRDRPRLGGVVEQDFGAVLALDEPFATGQVARQLARAVEPKQAEGVIARDGDSKIEHRIRGPASRIEFAQDQPVGVGHRCGRG